MNKISMDTQIVRIFGNSSINFNIPNLVSQEGSKATTKGSPVPNKTSGLNFPTSTLSTTSIVPINFESTKTTPTNSISNHYLDNRGVTTTTTIPQIYQLLNDLIHQKSSTTAATITTFRKPNFSTPKLRISTTISSRPLQIISTSTIPPKSLSTTTKIEEKSLQPLIPVVISYKLDQTSREESITELGNFLLMVIKSMLNIFSLKWVKIDRKYFIWALKTNENLFYRRWLQQGWYYCWICKRFRLERFPAVFQWSSGRRHPYFSNWLFWNPRSFVSRGQGANILRVEQIT